MAVILSAFRTVKSVRVGKQPLRPVEEEGAAPCSPMSASTAYLSRVLPLTHAHDCSMANVKRVSKKEGGRKALLVEYDIFYQPFPEQQERQVETAMNTKFNKHE